MLKPGQIKWYNGRRYRITRISKNVITRRTVCKYCEASNVDTTPPSLCLCSRCLRTMPADCYPKPDPRTPKRL